jgi:putative hydrolases of HD superfamily
MASQSETRKLADTVTHLGGLALAFGRVDRTACYHPSGEKESDADHTVMLSWIAPALASWLYPELDTGLVAQFSAIHDMPEVYAGDTPTLRIDAAGLVAKREREHHAIQRLAADTAALPWVGHMMRRYEAQAEPEARFTRAVDKVLPKLVHQQDNCRGLVEQGISPPELRATYARQRESIRSYAGDFPELLDLFDELGSRAVHRLAQRQIQMEAS